MTASAMGTASGARVTAATIALAAIAAAAGAAALGLAALLLGAAPGFPPVQPMIAAPFAAAGTLAAIGGWLLVVRFVRRSAAVLRVLVPVALALSWIPDVVLLATGFVPGATPIAVVALMLMHVVAATAAVFAGRRIAPAR
ncbi:hypothetical protein [Salinibacterium sp. ZJ70]|uniref:hypothetical protein n=1 Tax=Salinibacterium sp. ZJ70 TaxID=2708084 RepID=UPI001422D364|nr:hypothetical protein [Salinibacterium sp. ZJ70]